jgi:hypothetical protein
MAITEFQRTICRRIADRRIADGESYVAGGAALNTVIPSSRLSRDIDLFHDTQEALAATWEADRLVLEQDFDVEIRRERPTFVEAVVRRGEDSVVMEWVCDSAFRFFPLVEHEDFGLTLHPFDLATNKILALVGRVEVRDWVDIIHCSDNLQPLGYLAWAACGKDPGYSPGMILEGARRNTHHSADEVASLAFDGPSPDAAALARRWREILDAAAATIDVLALEEIGRCVLTREGALFRGDASAAAAALAAGTLVFHAGSIRGAIPRIARA